MMGSVFSEEESPLPPKYSTRIPTPPPSPVKPPPEEFARAFPYAGFDPEYGADLMCAMFEREQDPEFDDTQEWLQYRRTLVDWTSEYGHYIGARLSTMHMAISLLDRALKAERVHRDHLGPTAIACVHMAIKFEETVDDVPSMEAINGYTQGQFIFSAQKMVQYELNILKALNWNIMTHTALHFAMHWMAQGALYPADTMWGKPCNTHTASFLRRYVDFFAELCLQKYSFRRFRESLKAAAFLHSSRRALRIDPVWNEQLQLITTYSEEALSECYTEVWDYYRLQFPNVLPRDNRNNHED